jgi:hypothetical protein
MDAVRIEHLFSGPLGVRMGERGKANDADIIRSADPKCLTRAVESALRKLKKRAEELSSDDSILIQPRIGDLAMTIDSVKVHANDIKGSTCFHL